MKYLVLTSLLTFSLPNQAAEVQRKIFLMGSYFDLYLSGKSEKDLMKISEEIILKLNKFEKNISTWKNDSEFSRFNQHPPGTKFNFSTDVDQALKQAMIIHQMTNGFFHPGLGKLIEAWGLRKTGAIPEDGLLTKLISASSMSHLKQSQQGYYKIAENFFLEEGGFAKGAALDIAKKISKKFSIKDFYFNFSGQIMTNKPRPLGIAHPDDRSQIVIELPVQKASLSTSANTVQKFAVNGKKFGHILNPHTARPVNIFHRSVSVIHQSATIADALSTGLFVMSEKSTVFYHWIKSHPDLSIIEIDGQDKNLTITASCNLKNKINKIHPTTIINYLCDE